MIHDEPVRFSYYLFDVQTSCFLFLSFNLASIKPLLMTPLPRQGLVRYVLFMSEMFGLYSFAPTVYCLYVACELAIRTVTNNITQTSKPVSSSNGPNRKPLVYRSPLRPLLICPIITSTQTAPKKMKKFFPFKLIRATRRTCLLRHLRVDFAFAL